MPTCKYCNSSNVKWKNTARSGDPDKWELWTVGDGIFMWKHNCGFTGLSSCKTCGESIRWKEVFHIDGVTYKPYHHTRDEEHACKWSKIKHLPKSKRPNYW